MPTRPTLLCAALAAMMLALLPGPRANAADLVIRTASPAVVYEFDAFTRRGVTLLHGGTLLVRNDGCWEANMRVSNANPYATSVGVVFRMFGPRGRVHIDIPAAVRLPVGPNEIALVDTSGCSARLARAYPSISRYRLSRIFSVR